MTLTAHLAELVEKHQALERSIEEEMARPYADNVRVADMKKKKLKLKELRVLAKTQGVEINERDKNRFIRDFMEAVSSFHNSLIKRPVSDSFQELIYASVCIQSTGLLVPFKHKGREYKLHVTRDMLRELSSQDLAQELDHQGIPTGNPTGSPATGHLCPLRHFTHARRWQRKNSGPVDRGTASGQEKA